LTRKMSGGEADCEWTKGVGANRRIANQTK
jgi:hypothetical protein